MKLEEYSTEQLIAELKKRKIYASDFDFKLQELYGVTWNDLTLHYTIDELEFSGTKVLKVAPFYNGRFCYENLGPDVETLLPSCLSESEECIYEYNGNPEIGIQSLGNLGFNLKRDDKFFEW